MKFLSASYRPQRNSICYRTNQHSPESRSTTESRRTPSEKISKMSEGSLVDHILEFLDSYPAYHSPKSSFTEFTQAC